MKTQEHSKYKSQVLGTQGLAKGLLVLLVLTIQLNVAQAHNKVVVIPLGPDAPFDRTIAVSGKGSALQNAQKLRNAVAVISAANPTASSPWLIYLEPGVFDLGAVKLTLPDFVTLTGSGRTATKIIGTADNLIEPGNSSEISALWVVLSNASGDGDAIDIMDSNGVRITGARIEGIGGTAEAINATNALDLVIIDVELIATGNAIGFNGGSMTLRSSTTSSSIAALNALGTSGTVIVESSRLEVTISDDVIAYQGGGNHTVTIYNSVLIGPDQTSRPGTASDALNIFNSHIDVVNAFAFNGTAKCAALSTPAPSFSSFTCR